MNPNRFVDFDPAALEIRHQVYNAGTGQAGQVVEEGIHYGVSQGVQIGAEETLIGLAGVGTIAAVEAANDVGLFDGAWRWCKSLFRGADEAMEGREIVNGAQLPRTLAQQRELARLAAEVREELLNNLDLLEQQLSEAQIRALAKDPGLMQRYFGTVLEARVASQVNQIVRSDPDSVLSGLHWTGLTKAPQDFIGPNGHGFDITGSSRASIMDHNARPAVNAVITYESVPRDLGNQFNNR